MLVVLIWKFEGFGAEVVPIKILVLLWKINFISYTVFFNKHYDEMNVQ